MSDSFERQLARLLNQHSKENKSGTPDFILAEFMLQSLEAFERAIKHRGEWRHEKVEFAPWERTAKEIPYTGPQPPLKPKTRNVFEQAEPVLIEASDKMPNPDWPMDKAAFETFAKIENDEQKED
jgi:hypothetical protein